MNNAHEMIYLYQKLGITKATLQRFVSISVEHNLLILMFSWDLSLSYFNFGDPSLDQSIQISYLLSDQNLMLIDFFFEELH